MKIVLPKWGLKIHWIAADLATLFHPRIWLKVNLIHLIKYAIVTYRPYLWNIWPMYAVCSVIRLGEILMFLETNPRSKITQM